MIFVTALTKEQIRRIQRAFCKKKHTTANREVRFHLYLNLKITKELMTNDDSQFDSDEGHFYSEEDDLAPALDY